MLRMPDWVFFIFILLLKLSKQILKNPAACQQNNKSQPQESKAPQLIHEYLSSIPDRPSLR